ncbi:O-antigen ligase family protein [Acidaminococcus timonensis]|uniref:O-antigen ligase family protein n=1 Tax=Acidaminococcus timonensis TaxID=1871002 RepID=UPI00307C9A9B
MDRPRGWGLPTSWNLNQCTFAVLCVLFFILPLNQLAAGIVFSICFLMNLVNCWRTRQFWPAIQVPKIISRPLWVLFLLSAASVLWSPNPLSCGLNWLWVVGQETGLFYLVLRYASTGRRSLFLIKMFMISAGIVAAYGIWQYFFGTSLQNAEWIDHEAFKDLSRRAISTLVNPNLLGAFLVTTVAYCEGIFAPLKGGKTRWSLVGIFLLATACLILTFSRGNWVAYFWVLFVFAGAFYHKAFLPFIGGGLGVLYVGWSRLAARIMSIFSIHDTSAELRFFYLQSSLDMIEDHPFGVGWYGYGYAFPDYNFFISEDVFMYHSHNLLLNITAELGIEGLLLFLFLMVQMFKLAREIRHRKRTRPWIRGVACGYMASLVGIFIGGLTDHTLFNSQLGMLFWAGNAIVLIMDQLSRPPKKDAQNEK